MSAEPRYNIRAVERMTGVPAPTLRSWERRYGFPTPARTATARRLYSDDDVRSIRWVRGQTERGLAVVQAVAWARTSGEPPSDDAISQGALAAEPLVAALVAGVTRYDEMAVETALSAAFARYAADAVLLEVMTPALVEVGERWARGDLPVAAEHFFSAIIRRRLLALLAVHPTVSSGPVAALACLPGQQHELGLLMLALFLRWAGMRVLYLGADMPVADLLQLAAKGEVNALCLSAGPESDFSTVELLLDGLRVAGREIPVFLGGVGVARALLPAGARVLSGDLRAAAATITHTVNVG